MFHCARKQKKTQSAYGLFISKEPCCVIHEKVSNTFFSGLVVFFRLIYFDDIQFLMFVIFSFFVCVFFSTFKKESIIVRGMSFKFLKIFPMTYNLIKST